MDIPRRTERRCEPRTTADLMVMVWGVDTEGERFLQEARARDISLSGAMLSGLDADLRSGDVIGILYEKRKARFRVIWVRYDETGDKMQVAVHRVQGDECPWLDLVSEEPAESLPPPDHPTP
ncbi:MAG TPA: PilZ domain-containing protein [Candidatus Dormibacteraeota bacterium]|nr:PilZ domain-containing protein [Candidatus Dormibacteraeota bacterium]